MNEEIKTLEDAVWAGVRRWLEGKRERKIESEIADQVRLYFRRSVGTPHTETAQRVLSKLSAAFGINWEFSGK